jgi:predicted RNase H-like HicB family nuclease
MTQSFLTVIEHGPESFGAFSPDIQGCIAFSTSRTEVSLLYKLAVEGHLRELAKAGEPLPISQTEGFPGIAIGVQTGAITLEWTTVEVPLRVGAEA